MSLSTWKAKYYHISASDPEATATERAAVEHCLRKWEGLTPEALNEHGLHKEDIDIVDDGENSSLEINSSSCALCERHRRGYDCNNCVLGNGTVLPVGEHCSNNDHSPYYAWDDGCNPLPMVEALRKALTVLP